MKRILPAALMLSGFAMGAGAAQATVVTGIVATPGNHAVFLTWTPVSGALGYNLYRGTTSGSYSKITPAAVTVNAYLDCQTNPSTLANGTAEYYVVTAVLSSGETPYSAQVSATPVAQNGTWNVVYTSPVNTATTPVYTASTGKWSYSVASRAAASCFALGVFTIGTPPTSTATSTGQWIATWNPGTPGALPTLLVLKHTTAYAYTALVNNATSGTAAIVNTLTNLPLAKVTYPNSLTQTQTVPLPAPVWNLSDLTQVTQTVTTASSVQAATGPSPSPGWQDTEFKSVDAMTVYTGAYFQTPAHLTIALPATSIGMKATITGSSTSASGDLGAFGTIQDVVSVQ